MENEYPILEFDPSREAMIEPNPYDKLPVLSERAVGCFCQDVLNRLLETDDLQVVHHLVSEMGERPVYEMIVDGMPVSIFQPGVGASFAAASIEEMVAHGCRKFVICGGCGVLEKDIVRGHLVVVTSAVRDEGTSYHYLPPGREVAPSAAAVESIKSVLDEQGLPYILGKTWTTDGFYRETKAKARRRAAEGCKTVEMEAAAMFAVAQFRNVDLGLILYGGDDLSGEVWDSRSWDKDDSCRMNLFRLAAQACARM